MTQTNANETITEAIKAALIEILKTGNSAPKLYLRVRPNGTVDVTEETSWCCSPDEYYKRVPHTLSLEVVASCRDYSSLSDAEIEECADNAEDGAGMIMDDWGHQIAEWITAGNLVTQTTKYEARMGGATHTITAETLEEAIEQAKDWARDGDWDTTGGTIWVHAYLIETEDGEERAHRITVRIDPDEPACEDGADHDWQAPLDIVGGIKESPGVWGHGGGVTIQEVCLHCGCGKLTDTWAQDPETGEQGLRSIRYEPGKYA